MAVGGAGDQDRSPLGRTHTSIVRTGARGGLGSPRLGVAEASERPRGLVRGLDPGGQLYEECTQLAGVAGRVRARGPADRRRRRRGEGAQGSAGCLPGQPQGAPGIGDDYYPTYGNGGYDVQRYVLGVAYDPATDVLDGKATIRARATQSVCSFNLDFVGLEISSDHRRRQDRQPGPATARSLTVTPSTPLERRQRFEVFVRYGGVPVEFVLPGLRHPHRLHGDPRRRHRRRPARGRGILVSRSTTTRSTRRRTGSRSRCPRGYEVAANGLLRGTSTSDGGRDAPGEWVAREPMASYLATIDIGYWDVSTAGGPTAGCRSTTRSTPR